MQKRGEGGRSQHTSKRFLQRKIADVTKKFDGDTQHIRASLIQDLKRLQEIAVNQVVSKRGPKGKEKQNWAKLAAYISQVINGVARNYDVAQIKSELEELRRVVGEMDKS
ncbi:MAG: hypothetical protein NWF04_06305 [Candidatus Bathyarchaeota archaeon]|nr:hypothetical protein [Candidatus Bathyarchaeota archaeon]